MKNWKTLLQRIAGKAATALLLCPIVAMAGDDIAATGKPTGIKADRMILLDMVSEKDALVAVGERGVILRSRDGGQTWSRIPNNITRTLSAIAFRNERGVIVGHNGTLLISKDRGDTWTPVAVPEFAGVSLLGVAALSDGRLLAYGAFGFYAESSDWGVHWSRRQILGDSFEAHISQIAEVDDRLILVGEAGTLAVSDDWGNTWRKATSPYGGSFFGVLRLSSRDVLIHGMRGNVFRSSDRGETWTKVEVGIQQGINGGYVASDGSVTLAANGGVILMSNDGGKTFRKQVLPGNVSIAKALFNDGNVIYVGAFAEGRFASPFATAKK